MKINVRLAAGLAATATLLATTGVALYQIRHHELPSLAASQSGRLVGAFHMHSNDSHDSNVPVEDLAAAARQNNLDFLIVTDHNKQKPSALTIAGVTLLSYAELSTVYGHVVGLGANYTLDRTLRDDAAVLRHIRGAGGAPVITHPSDLKRPWSASTRGAAGVEIANLAAAARRVAQPAFFGMLPLLISWPLNPPLALAQLIDRDAGALSLWDANPDPQFVGLCGTDAHGWIPLALNLRAWFLVIDSPGAPDNRPAALLKAVQEGNFHCVSGLLGRDPTFAFSARLHGQPVASPGASVRRDGIDELAVNAPSTSAGPSQIVLLRDGREITRTVGNTLLLASPEPGTYRTEIRALVPNLLFGSRWEPVIYSNRLRILPAGAGG